MMGAWHEALGQKQAPRPSAHLLTALLAAGLAVVVSRLATKLVRSRRSSQDAAGAGTAAAAVASGSAASGNDEVTASARLIAAWRALESVEPQPLFVDPLASALAGSEGMRAALQLARPWGSGSSDEGGRASASSDASQPAAADGPAAGQLSPSQQQQQAKQTSPARRFCFSNVSTRVWWFDRQLTAALAGPSQPRQVVVLGAGLDSRPWRMALPPGVRWWEVDMPHVVAAKRRQLAQLGAALTAAAPAAHAHPLRAAAWQAVPADLGQPGWGEALQAAGLDASKPVVWVAEGLLMYLTDDQAAALLRGMAELSPPGSVLIAHNVTTDLLRQIESGGGLYGPFSRELVATWRCFYPPAFERPALADLLQQAGWHLAEVTTRARIAAAVCGQGSGDGGHSGSGGGGDSGGSGAGDSAAGGAATGEAAVADGASSHAVAGCVDFEARPDQGEDRFAVFFTAER
ncbi:S-adenosyl-L-methionine-dependent methyltransferase [Chlorella sorokiniana]|uniref:S-adenosyl-L-methionine-dependent methyltransferase n=1 Tax=Chlorella sorokiniana TaxID=3076 RepID=A0A2P6U2W6_CHLSO|nr:S-adenosyl-L-methionine-dependent methyltransferase [Chlorella sorokiniana]|eukprot:PRW60657.1 S-adenosyl-L-methionine-dependent methyltransferase [Chlorella sorokiniana]